MTEGHGQWVAVNSGTLPPPPPASPAPRKKRDPAVRKALLAAAAGLVIIGAVSSAIDDEPADSVTSPITVDIDSPTSLSEAYSQLSPLMFEAADEMGSITSTSAIEDDLVHLERAAELLDEAATYFDGLDDTMATYLRNAASHTRLAADAESGGDFVTFNAEIEAATADIQSANALIPG